MAHKSIDFDGIPVGPEHPPVLLPDIDMFFNKDLAAAERMIRQMITDDLPIVKGAVLHRPELALDDGTLETYYTAQSGNVQENYRALMERKVISLHDTEALFNICKAQGVRFALSVYDIEGAAFARDIGACALKIASSNITHEALIGYVSRLGLPVIIDTGKSTMEEIARAVNWAHDSGLRDLIIEHSPEAPPAPLSRHNLRMMDTLAQTFNCPVGLSDHHHGEEMLYAAVARGASVLEKSVCWDEQAVDQDVYHAIGFERIGEVWKRCLNIHEALGSPLRHLERDRPKPVGRMGLITKQALSAGQTISLDTVDFAFPARGIGAEHWSRVCDLPINKHLPAGAVIRWADLDVS